MPLWKQTLFFRVFTLFKVPLLFLVRPKILELDDTHCEVRVPLGYWTKNHWGSMYFGALAIGADGAGGLLMMHLIRKSGEKISLIFKDFQADFLKRPEADVHFTCADGAAVHQAVQQTIRTGERVNTALSIIATTPRLSGAEPVAKFKLTLSLKLSEK